MTNIQTGYNISPSERDNQGFDNNSRNPPGFHYVRANDEPRNLQIHHYSEVLASRKISILASVVALVVLLCFLTTLMTVALNSENSYPKVHCEMIDKNIVTEETPFEEFKIVNDPPNSEYPHPWEKLEKISKNRGQRLKRNIDQNEIKLCKQNRQKCQRLMSELLTLTNGDDKNVNQIEQVMAKLSESKQQNKLKNLNYCLQCLNLQVRGQLTFDDSSQESYNSNRDIYSGYAMPDSEQPEYFPLPIPGRDNFPTTQELENEKIKNGNNPNMQVVVTRTNNTKIENGVVYTNILKNMTIIEKPTTEKSIPKGHVQTDGFSYYGYENGGHQNAGGYQNSGNNQNSGGHQEAAGNQNAGGPQNSGYQNSGVYENAAGKQNAGGYQNAAGYQNSAGNQNTGGHQTASGTQNADGYQNSGYQNPAGFQSSAVNQNAASYQNGHFYGGGSIYQNGPSYQKGPTYPSESIYQNGPNYQKGPVFSKGPIYQNGPLYQNPQIFNDIPYFQAPEIPAWDSPMNQGNQGQGNSEIQNTNLITPPEIKIQMFPGNGTKITFNVTDEIDKQNKSPNFDSGVWITETSTKDSNQVSTTDNLENATSDYEDFDGTRMSNNRFGNTQKFGSNCQNGNYNFPQGTNPTAESMSVSHQVQITPTVTWNPYPVCFYGPPPPNIWTFPAPGRGVPFVPQGQNQGIQNPMNPGPGPLFGPLQPRPGMSFAPIPQMQQNFSPMQPNPQMQQNFPQMQPNPQMQFQNVGPTGPGQNIFTSQNNPNNRMPPNVPYYCTYIPTPTIQYPTIPGASGGQFQRGPFRNSEADERGFSDNNARSNPFIEGWSGHCTPGTIMCKNGIGCIPRSSWCDGIVNCADASDEILCSCRDRVGQDRICDGYFDCPRGEDELGCFGCPPNSFSCHDQFQGLENGNCIPLEQRCDGFQHCPNAKDEKDCSILTTSSSGAKDLFAIGHTTGYLHKNWRGQWYPVCSYSDNWAREACLPEMGPEADQNDMPVFLDTPMQEFVPGPFVTEGPNGFPELVSTCSSKLFLVQCPPISCGTSMEESFYSRRTYRNNNESDSKLLEKVSQQAELIQNDNNPMVGVVGGRASKPKAWPFVVAIFKNGNFHCGGVIINANWILTAAHCVEGFTKYYYEVQAGMLRRNSFSPMAQIRKADRVALHPNFNQHIMKNDIALILLDQPLSLNRWVRPACIPDYNLNFPQPGTTCVVVGWGAIFENGPDPDHLREVEVPILSHCKHALDQTEGEICAGYAEGGKDACQGDSGGPLLCTDTLSGSQWFAAGIVSHGEGCAKPDEPGAYTRVSKYTPWINEMIGASNPGFLLPTPIDNCPGFQCQTGTQHCLPLRKQCDGRVDCLGAEDEIDCYTGGLYRNPDIENQNENPQQIFGSEKPQQSVTKNPGNYGRFTTEEGSQSTATENYQFVTYVPPTNRFTCQNLIQIISLDNRCDGVYDCEDGTDEKNCTCKEVLGKDNPNAICDGNIDCLDGSDEDNCEHCNEDQYNCRRSGSCINLKFRCDRKSDCQLSEDELDCLALTNGEYLNLDYDGRPHLNSEGVVTKFVDGVWSPVCFQSNSIDKKVTLSNMGSQTCQYLGFRYLDYVREIKVRSGGIPERNNIIDYEYPPLYKVPSNGNQTCPGIYIRCQPFLNNPVNAHAYLSLTPQKVTYQWPWYGAILTNGKYRCPALLLEPNWVLTSSQCSKNIDLATNYTIGVFGVASYKPGVHRPNQQIAEIDEIRSVKNSDASLFHLRNPINRTRYVQPIFNEKRIFSPNSNDSCLAVGVDHKFNSKSMFVRPVMTCPRCQRCYILTDSTNCKINNNTNSQDWSGTVSCLGPGGWYPSGIFQNLDSNCGFNKTETIESIDYMNAHIMDTLSPIVQPVEGPPCDGIRCLYGKCVPWNKVCDGLLDCPDAADEMPKTCQEQKERCEKYNIGCKCTKQEMQCGDGQCIPKEKFCDKRDDCSDGSDEPEDCNCVAYLKVTAPHKICDNKRDCYDKSDELPNLCPCKDGSFHCQKQKGKEYCVSKDMACDFENDCPDGEDETHCKAIQGSLKDRNGTGEVMKRSFGVWHSECFSSPLTSESDALTLCQSMGFESGTLANQTAYPQRKPVVPDRDVFNFVRINEKLLLPLRKDKPFVTLVPPSQPCHRLFVNCV